jgi:two-component system, OmpR family, response regulator QseB
MRILYLEDEADIAEGVAELLTGDRYDVTWVRTLDEAFDALSAAPFDLALLDVMIGDDETAGFGLARTLREAGFEGQVLFLTARDSVSDRVHGLDIGGDDYLVKPFSFDELRARVRALLRRGSSLKQARLQHGALEIDLMARSVRRGGTPVDLSDREFAMLELFVHDSERVFPAAELRDRLFPTASGPAVVRVYVGTLRKKLGESVIDTLSGGYRLGSG